MAVWGWSGGGRPAENAKGYHNGSPISFAEGLKGKLLIVHGTGDRQCTLPGRPAIDQSSGGAGEGVRLHGVPKPDSRDYGRARHAVARAHADFAVPGGASAGGGAVMVSPERVFFVTLKERTKSRARKREAKHGESRLVAMPRRGKRAGEIKRCMGVSRYPDACLRGF
ncbi:hypothetical protein SBA4_950005 [Candidatus Sulfopaludibacter sp. SbA4]|nr:hypothetical protein SBA4_950005 [Candidatus Sulfopaludibacter sp. SbA4]